MALEFHSWRRSVRMALNIRNKLGFIDDTIPRPLLSFLQRLITSLFKL